MDFRLEIFFRSKEAIKKKSRRGVKRKVVKREGRGRSQSNRKAGEKSYTCERLRFQGMKHEQGGRKR